MATPNLSVVTTVTPRILASTQLVSGEQTIYTVGANKGAKLAKLVLTNTTATAVVVSVSVVKSGSTAGSANRVVASYSIAGYDTTIVTEIENVWLGDGDFLSVNASASTAVNATASGLEFT